MIANVYITESNGKMIVNCDMKDSDRANIHARNLKRKKNNVKTMVQMIQYYNGS
jgi:hypothetical protein